jgi:uncharacterized protein YeaO (DUF488 family)
MKIIGQQEVEVEEMKGKLWTGRIYDFKKMKAQNPSLLLVCVMRWPPKYINLKKEGILHMPALSPAPKLLKSYQKQEKNEDNWRSFVEKFVRQLERDVDAMRDRFTLRYILVKGTQIVLLCHERIDEHCHRQILPYIILNDREIDAGVYQGELCFETSVQTKLSW